jgi:diaminohydroxyphosphoribosylaminopyrimidine deaminase/5-amino-6-(5-phosphoribosylamino)uracil reductase
MYGKYSIKIIYSAFFAIFQKTNLFSLTISVNSKILDKKYISRCIKLASKGRGNVSPNPLVGAVIVKNGKVIGEGYHKKYGDAHAEVYAIKNSTESVAGSTLYCNLETCCHTKKQTPPCVPLIIENKIKRVVISNVDPNKKVNGKGIAQLREAGIEVLTGLLEEEGEELNKFYFKYIERKLPYITLKVAQSIDGKISLARNRQTWLTGKESVKFVHQLRTEYDAILVGAGTIKTDNPLLNVREVKGRNPIRVIVDGKLSININSKVLNSDDPSRTYILYSDIASKKKVNQIKSKGVKLFEIQNTGSERIDLKVILKILAENKITSILVEGGNNIFTQFLEEDLFDEIILIQTPKILGKGISAFSPKKLKKLKLSTIERLEEDIKLVYRKNNSNS